MSNQGRIKTVPGEVTTPGAATPAAAADRRSGPSSPDHEQAAADRVENSLKVNTSDVRRKVQHSIVTILTRTTPQSGHG